MLKSKNLVLKLALKVTAPFLVIATMVAASIVPAIASPAIPHVKVEIRAGQIQQNPMLPAQDLSLEFQGVYKEIPSPIDLTQNDNTYNVRNLIARMIKVNSDGNPAEMASIFLPEERPVALKTYSDPQVVEPNKAFFNKLTGAMLNGYVLDEDVVYILITLQGPTAVKLVVPAMRADGNLFLTNTKANLGVIAQLTAAFRQGQITNMIMQQKEHDY